MIRVCPDRDAICPNGDGCAEACSGGRSGTAASPHALPLHPDFGKPSIIAAPGVYGGYACNFAQVVELARTGGTPQARTFYRALMARWRALERSSLSDDDRKIQSINAAMAETARVHGPAPTGGAHGG